MKHLQCGDNSGEHMHSDGHVAVFFFKDIILMEKRIIALMIEITAKSISRK